MTAINPAFSLTAEDLALLSDEQFAKLRGAVDRLRGLVLADERRRLDDEKAERDRKFEVLGKDARATCLAHRRQVRWIPAPGWWIHSDDLPGKNESCRGMWDVVAPVVIVRRVSAGTTGGRS